MMFKILRHRDFLFLWSGQLLSNLGNWLLILALPVYVFEVTGSVASTSAAVLAQTLPALLIGPLAGVAADRWNRRTIMILCDLLRAVTILAMLAVDDPGDMWLLYATLFAESCLAQFFGPANRALLPGLVGRGPELSAANALNALSGGIVRAVGGPLGGVLYLTLGFRWLVVADAVTYVVSALLLSCIRYSGAGLRPEAGKRPSTPRERVRTVWRDLVQGVTALRRNPTLPRLLACSSIFLLGNSALTVMLVPYVYERLDGDAGLVGALFCALGIGFIISAPLARRLADASEPRWALAGALTAVNISYVGLFDWPHRAAALISICGVGIAGGAVLAVVQTLIQRHTVDAVLGRVSAAFSTIEMLATVVGAALGGAVAAALGLTTAANLAIALVVIAILLALAVPRPPSVAPTSPAPAGGTHAWSEEAVPERGARARRRRRQH
jgi:predicted MFS family arabinose efflux permease